MDGHAFPDQEQLLQVLRRLKEVFDVCDEDADGFIRVEHLEDLGLQFGQGDEVTGQTKSGSQAHHEQKNIKDPLRRPDWRYRRHIGPHPGARPGVGARRRAPGGRVFAHLPTGPGRAQPEMATWARLPVGSPPPQEGP
ncbi:hypothetical protein L3Q82_002917 [Scortum barcoo]|uniref:Uncharacterized protein n=1 Tax=Scortum barcoo TaxID=214431 RepID=A0ACB8VW38_9TELE|nr:hypothetical protein L3Q82_002917 [Scortum barcoo]